MNYIKKIKWLIVLFVVSNIFIFPVEARRCKSIFPPGLEGSPEEVTPLFIQYVLEKAQTNKRTFFQIIGRPGGGKSFYANQLVEKLRSQLPSDVSLQVINVDDYLIKKSERPTTEEKPYLHISFSKDEEFSTAIGWKFRQSGEGELQIITPIGEFKHKFEHSGENFIVPILILGVPPISIQYEGGSSYIWRMPAFLSKISWDVYRDIMKFMNGEPVLKPIYRKEIGDRLKISTWRGLNLDSNRKIQNWVYSPQKSRELGKEIFVDSNKENPELRELITSPEDKKSVLIVEGVWLGFIPEINKLSDGTLAVAPPNMIRSHWLKGRTILTDAYKGIDTVPERIHKQEVDWTNLQDPYIEPAINNVRQMPGGFIIYNSEPAAEKSEREKALSTSSLTGGMLDLEQRVSKALERYEADKSIEGKEFNPSEFLNEYLLPVLASETSLYKCVELIISTAQNGADIGKTLTTSPLFKQITPYEKAVLLQVLINLKQNSKVSIPYLNQLLEYLPSDAKLHRCIKTISDAIVKGKSLKEVLENNPDFTSLNQEERDILSKTIPQIPFLLFEPPKLTFIPKIKRHPKLSKELGELFSMADMPYALQYLAKDKNVVSWLTKFISNRYKEEGEISAIADEVKNAFVSASSILYLWEKLQEYSEQRAKISEPNIAVLGCGDLYPWIFLYFAAHAKELDGIERETEFQSSAKKYITEFFTPGEEVNWINGNMVELTEINDIKGKHYDYIFVRLPHYIKDLYSTLLQAKEFLTEEGEIILFIRERDFITKKQVSELIEEGVKEFDFMEFDTYPLGERSTQRSARCVVLNKKKLEELLSFLKERF